MSTAINLATNLPWANLNFTLLSSIQLSAELINHNGGNRFGGLSEESLEAKNKDINKFMCIFSR